jgi:mRNA-degrading endonuclease HigB of HigAB toxin-antitoxin module
MVIISKSQLTSFGAIQPDAISALNDWYTKTKAADWKIFIHALQH